MSQEDVTDANRGVESEDRPERNSAEEVPTANYQRLGNAGETLGELISERKRVAEALRQSEENFRSLVEGVKDCAIFRLDREGRVLSWNRGAERIKGYQPHEILGKHFSVFYPPEDIERGAPERCLAEALEKGQFEGEGWRLRKNGSRFWASVVITPLHDQAGNLCGFAKVTCDVTERKRTEDALRKWELIFRHAGWGVAIANPSTQVLEAVNPAFASMHGYTVQELTGKSLADTFAPESRATLPVHARIANETGRYVYESLHIRRDGTRFPVLTDVIPVKDGLGNVLYHAGNFQDITERKEAEEALWKTKEDLELRVKERTAELAKINQELQTGILERVRGEEQLRNSMVNMRALAARLQGAREEERTRVAREIHDVLGQACTALKMDLFWIVQRLPKNEKQLRERGESMLKLIDETIQSVRKMSSQLRPSTLDDLGLTAALEWQAQEFEARAGIKCGISLPAEEVTMDTERATAIFRIFQETLTNVARHANATRVDVRLVKDGEMLVLEVSDNGKGLDEAQASIGKSLGLLGMKERAILVGGKFQIMSTPGKGTTVIVRIPAAERRKGGQQSRAGPSDLQ